MTRREVTVYPITSRELFFRVPHAWCEECDVTIRLVSEVADDIGDIWCAGCDGAGARGLRQSLLVLLVDLPAQH